MAGGSSGSHSLIYVELHSAGSGKEMAVSTITKDSWVGYEYHTKDSWVCVSDFAIVEKVQ
jgi:hypothetical protein